MQINNINLAEQTKSELEGLQKNVFDHIQKILNIKAIEELDNFTRKELEEKIVDLRENNKLNIIIDNLIRKILQQHNIESDFLQFPVNIRIISSGKNSKYEQQDFNVDTVHCDHWSGAPEDSYNCYLYLRKTSTSPSLVHFKVPAGKLIEVDQYRGPYKNAPKFDLERVDHHAYSGLLQRFNCKIPHMIDREGSGATISLDFRLRNRSKVFAEDLSKKTDSEWTSSKMTSLCVYWKAHNLSVTSIREKIEEELRKTEDLGERYRKLRLEYCDRFYNYKASP